MQGPAISLDWAAMGVAFVAAFIFGFLWYGPLLGKVWAKEMGMDFSQKPDPKTMRKAFILQSVWNAGTDASDVVYGFFGGFFVWLGFYLPMQFGKISWENRSWRLFFINTSYDFLNLQLMSQILAHMH